MTTVRLFRDMIIGESGGTVKSDCRSEEGITIGLIDAMISIGRVLAKRMDNVTEPVYESLKDLHSDEAILCIMVSGPYNKNFMSNDDRVIFEQLKNVRKSIFDEAYNAGIGAAVKAVEIERDAYWSKNTHNIALVRAKAIHNNVISKLESLKKK